MPLSKDDFKDSQLTRPNLFFIEMPNISIDYVLLTTYVKEAEMPGFGENEEKPKSWKLVFINDEKQKLRISFVNWLYSAKRTFDTKIHQINNRGQIIHTCSFNGLYPIGVSSLKFGHALDVPQVFSVYFSYDNIKMDFNLPQPCSRERDLKETNKETSNV